MADDPKESAPLGKRGRQVILSLHLLIVGAWLGALVVVAVFLSIGRPTSAAALDRGALEVHEWVVIPCSLAVFVTSLAFAVGTPWGLVRHKWLLVKWAILLGVAPFDVFVVTPALARVAARSDLDGAAAFATEAYRAASRGALTSAGVELALVAFAFVLSVVKPWGKTTAREPRRLWTGAAALVLVVGVAGVATPISIAQRGVRAYAPRQPDLSGVPDGAYDGAATHFGIEYKARVTVAGGRLARMEATGDHGGTYAELARGIAERVTRAGTVEVDAISGASTTSRALQHAAVDAMERAPRR